MAAAGHVTAIEATLAAGTKVVRTPLWPYAAATPSSILRLRMLLPGGRGYAERTGSGGGVAAGTAAPLCSYAPSTSCP
eukprot:2864308-Rhodomonas_salina.1